MKSRLSLTTGFSLTGLRPKGFTLIEVVIVVLVVAILAGIAVVSYQRIIGDAEDNEAVANLGAIRQAEFAERAQTGTFANVSTTEDVAVKLDILELQDKIFRYKVVNATLEDFVALAERIMEDPVGKKTATIALSADGNLSKSTAYYGRGYGGQGGAYGGGSGGGSSSSGGGGGGGGGPVPEAAEQGLPTLPLPPRLTTIGKHPRLYPTTVLSSSAGVFLRLSPPPLSASPVRRPRRDRLSFSQTSGPSGIPALSILCPTVRSIFT